VHEEVRATFAQERKDGFALVPPGTHDYLRIVEKDHGRLEIRQHWTLHDPELLAHLDPAGAWAQLRAIGLVERERRVGDRVAVERPHYLLSAPLSAAAFAAAVRSHWGIENRVHWVLDVAFNEDACRARAGHAARNLAVVRHLALNLLRQDATRKGSIATKRFAAALDDAYLTTILAGLATQHADDGN
jgi:predicted transposase YbfD/YdcC